MRYSNKNFKESKLNQILTPLFNQKQKINNSKKYTNEEKKMIMKGLDMAIDSIWRNNSDRHWL
ncbi:hypothetical protein [Anaerovorax sp. IOR16]|uniref:hypothetical protein n=1 Tax=Anaerovorax sp. IOR16 TaxID=2773458 RepID=UPI0019D03561|nr:hypothetical protein [Anaerovorax sp. IOR16]